MERYKLRFHSFVKKGGKEGGKIQKSELRGKFFVYKDVNKKKFPKKEGKK